MAGEAGAVDGTAPAACRSCHVSIEWAVTEKKMRRMPLDVLGPEGPAANANLAVVARKVPTGEPIVRTVAAGEGTRISHFATCPNRLRHRKGRSS